MSDIFNKPAQSALKTRHFHDRLRAVRAWHMSLPGDYVAWQGLYCTGQSIYQYRQPVSVMGCLHDPANVQQTSSKCIQNTRANAGRLLDRVNTL